MYRTVPEPKIRTRYTTAVMYRKTEQMIVSNIAFQIDLETETKPSASHVVIPRKLRAKERSL